MVPDDNGLVWSAQASDPQRAGFGLCVHRRRQRDTHDYPPSTDLLLMMTSAGVFVDGRLICSKLPSDGFSGEALVDHGPHRAILFDQHTVEVLVERRDSGGAGASKRIENTSAARADQRADVFHQWHRFDTRMIGLMVGLLRLAVRQQGTRPGAIAIMQGTNVERTGSPQPDVIHHPIGADRLLCQQDRLQARLEGVDAIEVAAPTSASAETWRACLAKSTCERFCAP